MTIPAEHLDVLASYIAEHGEQRYTAIRIGMFQAHPSINVRRYLFKKLCNAGRIEKVGFDSYRVISETPDSECKDAS